MGNDFHIDPLEASQIRRAFAEGIAGINAPSPEQPKPPQILIPAADEVSMSGGNAGRQPQNQDHPAKRKEAAPPRKPSERAAGPETGVLGRHLDVTG